MDLFELPLKGYLRLLEQIAKENTELMKRNNELFNQKSGDGVSPKDKSEFLNVLLKKNSKLSAENKKLREIHAKVLEFIQEYKNRISIDIEDTSSELELSEVNVKNIEITDRKPDRKEFLKKTITGDVSLNESHPFRYDNEFLTLLLDYYTESEEYEKCAEIMKIKESE